MSSCRKKATLYLWLMEKNNKVKITIKNLKPLSCCARRAHLIFRFISIFILCAGALQPGILESSVPTPTERQPSCGLKRCGLSLHLRLPGCDKVPRGSVKVDARLPQGLWLNLNMVILFSLHRRSGCTLQPGTRCIIKGAW